MQPKMNKNFLYKSMILVINNENVKSNLKISRQ